MADTTTSALNWASVENGKVKTTTSKKSDESNNGTMGYDQFLTLLCAEMQYQDPLEPTSNTEYVAQLACRIHRKMRWQTIWLESM